MRGEKLRRSNFYDSHIGSPPHARGKGEIKDDCHRFGRITPACAGKRLLGAFLWLQLQDHPRMRGEKQGREVLW